MKEGTQVSSVCSISRPLGEKRIRVEFLAVTTACFPLLCELSPKSCIGFVGHPTEATMGRPFKPMALVVEDDVLQRELVTVLLEESEMSVIQCDSAEGALRVLEKIGGHVLMIFTDVNLTGKIDGVELAHFATRCYPSIHVVVTSGLAMTKTLPDGVMFMRKPWIPLDLLREAERSLH
jgi:CheY-like chemotaxis protein